MAITCQSAASRTSLRHTSPYRLHAFHFGFPLACRYSVLCSFRTPVAVSGSVGVVIPCGPSPRSLSASHASALLPRVDAPRSRAAHPFRGCLAAVCLARSHGLGSLHPVFRDFFATMQDSDSCPRRFDLPSFQGCAGRCGLLSAQTGLPGYPVSPSQHAISADTAGSLRGLKRLSRPPLPAFVVQVATRLSGSCCFDAH